MGEDRLTTDEKSVAKSFHKCLTSIVKLLGIKRKEFDPKHVNLSNNPVSIAVRKFQNHTSFENQIKPNLFRFQFSTSKL